MKKNELEVTREIDANWVGDKTHQRFTFGYFTFVGGTLLLGRVRNKDCCKVKYSGKKCITQSM